MNKDKIAGAKLTRAPLLFLPGLALAALYALATPFLEARGAPTCAVYGFAVGGALAAWANWRYGEAKPSAWRALLGFRNQTLMERTLLFYIMLGIVIYLDSARGFPWSFGLLTPPPVVLTPFDYLLFSAWISAFIGTICFQFAWLFVRGDYDRVFFVFLFGVHPFVFLCAAPLLFVLPRFGSFAFLWNTVAICAAIVFLHYAILAANFFIKHLRRGKVGGK